LFFKKIDIIYTRDRMFLFLSFFKKNVFYEAHTFPKHYWLYRFFFRRINGFIVITGKLKQFFIAKGIKDEKILKARSGVDLSIFNLDISKDSARFELGLPKNKQIIGYFGKFQTMGKEKGVLWILRALKYLPKNIIFLAVGGDDKEIIEYQNKAKKQGAIERTILLKRVPQKVLAKYQKACDVLLMPFPYSKHYAFFMSPLKMFEYMASKIPIIASDLPSIREVLNKNNSILCRPGDARELAIGIKKVLSDDKLADRISERAFLDVQLYDWQTRAKKIMEFIKTLAR